MIWGIAAWCSCGEEQGRCFLGIAEECCFVKRGCNPISLELYVIPRDQTWISCFLFLIQEEKGQEKCFQQEVTMTKEF